MSAGDLTCRKDMDPDDVRLQVYPDRHYFFNEAPAHVDSQDPNAWEGHSWVVAFANGRAAGTTLNPCISPMLYVVSVYFVLMTMMSIGYGDIVPQSFPELVLCTMIMTVGCLVWAYVIGAACEFASATNPEQRSFESRTDAFNWMVSTQQYSDVPTHTRCRAREYIRRSQPHEKSLRGLRTAAILGKSLYGEIRQHIASSYLDKIWYFQKTGRHFREEVASLFVPRMYEERTQVKLDRSLAIVVEGRLALHGKLLSAYQAFGVDMIVHNPSLCDRQAAVALTYVQVSVLSRRDLSDALVQFPAERRQIRRAAASMALIRGTQIMRKERAMNIKSPEYRWLHDIFATASGDVGATIEDPPEFAMPRQYSKTSGDSDGCSADARAREVADRAWHEYALPIGTAPILTFDQQLVRIQDHLEMICSRLDKLDSTEGAVSYDDE
eukprot:gnl/TRDRNA2_/TRDRNA2_121430_c1_seq1.p1 gnl/TRDRNA2_/TRDRNA2_121430_c1~~gnl/TRDRNA2_/TRDRNA2_121430_c1_seq1.p1  ORF type:complete len:482 (-),score=69.71 gnl/TRDRNA2_/TRDRNA2_121430_c1_seq1:22-1338(-)